MSSHPPVRRHITVSGVVQGVGFRPHVARLARRIGVTGWVRNGPDGVAIEVQGSTESVTSFETELALAGPPSSRIDHLAAHEIPPAPEHGFTIAPSTPGTGLALAAPDAATCNSCVAELLDPTNRRFGHPFISCADCGPRYSIGTGLPYDRERTTMARFTMCALCRAEYDRPTDRRHHAQTVSCRDCGPDLWYRSDRGQLTDAAEIVDQIVVDLRAGRTVALKGVGGYHLLVNAADDDAVAALRVAKSRPNKPFALLTPDLQFARDLAYLGSKEAELLTSSARPIVLLAAKHGSVSSLVAPNRSTLGLMLASTPVHHLLFAAMPEQFPIVCTSANISGDALVADDDEAAALLKSGVAQAICGHDLEISMPLDDSVVRVVDGEQMPVRLGRGVSPFAMELPFSVPPVFATGGDLKGTVCLASNTRAVIGQHLGDLEALSNQQRWRQATAALIDQSGSSPVVVAVDAHPGYHARRLGLERSGESASVQHHHGHMASLMADNGLAIDSRVVAFVFDGSGFGADGSIWGGEVLVGGYDKFDRFAHLSPVPMPGGSAAIHEPWRMAVAHLNAAGVDSAALSLDVSAAELQAVSHQIETGLNSPFTSSMGRLFDAVSVLLGGPIRIDYEAQTAVWLEEQASSFSGDVPQISFGRGPGPLDSTPIIRAIVEGVGNRTAPAVLARAFHQAVVELIAGIAGDIRALDSSLNTVGLTGGVFQNALLASLASGALQKRGFTVLSHSQVPPNDGGLSLGQAVVAGLSYVDQQAGGER